MDENVWKTRTQNKVQRFGRRNHVSWCLGKFMLSFGGMNDFNQIMSDLIIYDLETDEWVESVKLKNSKIPPTSHSSACSVFYP